MITPAFSLTATERVLPKLALDFTTASLDSRITFTRSAATATRTNSSGYVESVAANTPRFDYNPLTLVCRGLLIEEARINLVLYSQDFSNVAWTKNRTSISSVSVVAPDGASTSQKIVENTDNNSHYINSGLIAVTSGVSYSFSVYAKAAERAFIALRPGGASTLFGNDNTTARFDLSNGTVSSTTNCTATITSVGNGWYRCTQTAACIANGNTNMAIWLQSYGTYQGIADYGLYVWGAQFEAGAFATSYIPTTSAALTRNADVATMTGTNFSDWFNASEGTFEILVNPNNNTAVHATDGVPRGQFCVSDGTSANRLRYQHFGEAGVNSGGATVATLTFSGATSPLSNPTADRNITVSYKVNAFATARDGVAGPTDSAGAVPVSPNNIIFGYATQGYNGNMNGYVKKFSFYPQKLTANELTAFSKG